MSPKSPVRILLFAGVRDAAERNEIEVSIQADATAADVMETLASEIPSAGDLIRLSRLAVDGQYVAPDYVVGRPNGEVALIPPVSGG